MYLIYLPPNVFSGDPAFKFFYGMALVLEGQLQEGIRELDTVQNYTEVRDIQYIVLYLNAITTRSNLVPSWL